MRAIHFRPSPFVSRLFGDALFILIQLVGLAAFVYPFLRPQTAATEAAVRASDAPPILGVTLIALFALMAASRVNAKRVAVLGVLCAINAVLRLAETLILPLPGGFSPMFLLIILAGYAYGVRFGFLFGAFSLLTSALATGGVGPWLPFQMFGAGWVGLTAGLLSKFRIRNAERGTQPSAVVLRPSLSNLQPFDSAQGRPPPLRLHSGQASTPSTPLRAGLHPFDFTQGRPPTSNLQPPTSKYDLALLLPFGFVWGFLYGAILNLYFWPLVDAGAGLSWQAGLGIGDALARYAAFYAATSLWWDAAGAIGNAALLLWLGLPILRALRRFGARFRFEVVPVFEGGQRIASQNG